MRSAMWRVVLAAALVCASSAFAQTIGGPSLAQILNPAPSTRPGQSATLLPDGTWLLVGGKNDSGQPVATALISDPRIRQTTSLDSRLVQARTGHTATLMADGSVLIVGGVLENGALADTPERFDPASGQFQALPSVGLI